MFTDVKDMNGFCDNLNVGTHDANLLLCTLLWWIFWCIQKGFDRTKDVAIQVHQFKIGQSYRFIARAKADYFILFVHL